MNYTNILQSDYFIILAGFLVGAIIGLERQFSTEKEFSSNIGERMPGIRTFGLISLLGAISALYFRKYQLKEMLIFSIIVTVVLIIVYSILRAMYYTKDIGITTATAMSLAFISGTIIGFGDIVLGITLSIFTTFILAIKQTLSNLIQGLEYNEIKSALQIGILALLLFPLIPDVYDPIFHVINLRIFFLFLILVLFISFIAYIILRRFGPMQGLLTFTVMGGLINSEATAMNLIRIFERGAREYASDKIHQAISTGVLLVNISMIVRTIFLVSILAWWDVEFIKYISLLLGLPALFGILLAYLRFHVISESKVAEIQLESPLSYKKALKFTLAFTVITFLTILVEEIMPLHGLLLGSIIGGFVSNSAVILSVISLYATKNTLSFKETLEAILASTISSILNKVYYAKVAGANASVILRILTDNIILALLMLILFLIMV
ncbi:MAG: MgtC/SapB family protein [Candidatus Njordarchaeales archaeon]